VAHFNYKESAGKCQFLVRNDMNFPMCLLSHQKNLQLLCSTEQVK
jgi:hypothetical protein